MTPEIKELLHELYYHAIPNITDIADDIFFMAEDHSHRLRLSKIIPTSERLFAVFQSGRDLKAVFDLHNPKQIQQLINFLVDKGYNPALAYRRYLRLRALID